MYTTGKVARGLSELEFQPCQDINAAKGGRVYPHRVGRGSFWCSFIVCARGIPNIDPKRLRRLGIHSEVFCQQSGRGPPPCLVVNSIGSQDSARRASGDRWRTKSISIIILNHTTPQTAQKIVPKIGFGSESHCSTDITSLLL